MTIINKDILFRLVDRIEDLYLENLILRDELRHRNQREIAEMLKRAKTSPQITDRIHALFAPIRAGLIEEALLEQALQEFLKVSPPKDVN